MKHLLLSLVNLGDNLSYSFKESVNQTIIQRVGIGKHAIHELRAIIEDRRSQCLGGLNVAFVVWEQFIVLTLLHNAEAWGTIPRKSMKLLSGVFNSFYQSIFRIGTGTPVPNYYWQSGTLLCENMILQKKLGFVHHLANLGPDTLAGQVLAIEVANKLEGIVNQCMEHLNKLGFSDISELSYIMKVRFKKLSGIT